MESITKIFKIGNGPSSSHTMGPKKAAEIFAKKHSDAESYKVSLYGSLAFTGKGHMTDYIILKTLPKPTEIIWKHDKSLPLHPLYKYHALNVMPSVPSVPLMQQYMPSTPTDAT